MKPFRHLYNTSVLTGSFLQPIQELLIIYVHCWL